MLSFFSPFSRVFLQMKSQVQLRKIKQMQVECCGLSIVKGHRTSLPHPLSEEYVLYPNRFHLLFLALPQPPASIRNYSWDTLKEFHLSWPIYFNYMYFSFWHIYFMWIVSLICVSRAIKSEAWPFWFTIVTLPTQASDWNADVLRQ